MRYIAGVILFFSLFSGLCYSESYIRVNQVGYMKEDIKKAILGSDRDLDGQKFFVRNLLTNTILFSGHIGPSISKVSRDTPFPFNHIIDFSPVQANGSHRIELGDGSTSHTFKIGNDSYKTIIDSLLYFLRVARCGNTNPELHEPCHLHDATNANLDLTGGWHDAGDFLKFTKQIAFTTYLLLLSYDTNKGHYKKFFSDLNRNGIPDILDEAKIGLDYLEKCYPDEDTFIYQVGDFDADHRQWARKPEDDKLAATNRPALFGFDRNPLSKYAYTMALASNIFKDMVGYKVKAQNYRALAKRAYDKAKSTGSENFDKLCLAAVELYRATNEGTYLAQAKYFNDKLSTSDWGNYANNTNLAHARLAAFYPSAMNKLKNSVSNFYKASLDNLFGYDVQYAWGGLYVAISSGSAGWFYKLLTNDNRYGGLPRRIRDYTLGVNPWGVCFISGLGTVFPRNIHNYLAVSLKRAGVLENATFTGAIAEGPYDRTEWEKKWYRRVPKKEDIFSRFQTSACVYHDHVADYATNEPTIYGAAEAILFFSFYLRYLSNG